MKTILVLAIIHAALFAGATTATTQNPNDPVTKTFEVQGVCGMCKERIENAALIKGVKMAEWDKKTEMLKVVYRPKKVTLEQIHRSVAEAGHETSEVAANPEAYSKLPGCCKYKDGAHKH